MRQKLFPITLVVLNIALNFAIMNGKWIWASAGYFIPKVAVLDTGCNLNRDNIGGVSFTNSSAFDDSCGHGSLMSKIILDANPNIKLTMVKISETKNGFYPRTIARGLRWCLENNMDVVSLSFTIKETQEVKDIINKLVSNNIVVVAAVGNLNSQTGNMNNGWGYMLGSDDILYRSPKKSNFKIGFPAKMHNVISVGTINFWGDTAEFARSSGEISADGTWFGEEGTSISTARVAGYISMIKERYPNLSNAEIRDILQAIAKKKKDKKYINKSGVAKCIKNGLEGYFSRNYQFAMKKTERSGKGSF